VTVRFPSPRAFAQSLKQRSRALPGNAVLLVVEGASDKSALFPFLDDLVVVVPSAGKDMALGAYVIMQTGTGNSKCLFLLDCDGHTNDEFLGRPDLIISEHRDLESDLLYVFDSLERVLPEYLGPRHDSRAEILAESGRILQYVSELTAVLGVVMDAARAQGLRAKVRDARTNTPRRITLTDIDGVEAWVGDRLVPSYDELIHALDARLEWGADVVPHLLAAAREGAGKRCRLHGLAGCLPCRSRRYSNGHDLVVAIAQVLRSTLGRPVTEAEIARAVRMASDRKGLTSWMVATRVSVWEESSGHRIFRRD
jgi:hypothetical protein